MVIPPSSRLSYRTELDGNEFHDFCFALANRIDAVIGKDEVPTDAQDLAIALIHVCQHRCNDNQTRAVLMALMISVKNACGLGWFPQIQSQQLLALVDSMWKSFSTPENVASSLNSPVSLVPQVMERFYPFLKLGHILVSSEAEPESNILLKDFHISKKMLQHSPKQIGLFVFRTEDISKSSCIIHPQEVSFLLNGTGVDKRCGISMDSGPQRPTDVTALLCAGSNLLQTIGCFGGSYFIVIALLNDIPMPVTPSLKDYVHSEAIESNSDCDIIEGPSRISLTCPISRTRIKLPVKSHACKHLQCFDFWNYVEINTRTPSWRCPLCNQPVCYTDIRLDQNMMKILEEVGSNATGVVITADGSWRVVTENDENVGAVPETTHEHGDPNSFQNLGPTVLDLTRDENETETSGGTQVNEGKPCLSDIPVLNQSSASMDALPQLPQTLNVFDVQQQFMNFPDSAAREAIHMPFLPTSSPQDRIATNTGSFHRSMPAARSSQYQGSHVSPLGYSLRTPDLMDRWNQIYGNGISQTQLPPMPPPPLHHQYAMQNQRLPTRNMSPAQERPFPSSITHPQTLAVNYGGASDQRHMQVPMQRHVQRLNPGGAAEHFSSREFVNMTPANTANSRPQIRMRGSIMPGSTRYDHMIIRPTRPVQAQAQTLAPPQPTVYNYIPVQAQAQTLTPPQPTAYNYIPVQARAQTLPPRQPTAYYNIADQLQAFSAHPSYLTGTNQTQARTGSLPVADGVRPSMSFWSMPPETW